LASAIFPSDSPTENTDFSQHVWNSANGLAALCAHCTTVLPLSTSATLWTRPPEQRQFDYLEYQAKLPYHTSAILASALEAATTTWRRLLNFDQLSDVCDLMAIDGRKFAQLSSSLPLGMNKASDLLGEMNNSVVPLTPYSRSGRDQEPTSHRLPRMAHISMRGVRDVGLQRSGSTRQSCSAECRIASELLAERFKTDGTVLRSSAIYEPLYTKSPYPNIFSRTVLKNGTFDGKERPHSQAVSSVPTLTLLESSVQVGEFINAIVTQVGRLNWQKLKVDKDTHDHILNEFGDLSRPFLDQNF